MNNKQHGCHSSGQWKGQVSKNQGNSPRVGENLSLWKKSGEGEILRVHIYSFLSTFKLFVF